MNLWAVLLTGLTTGGLSCLAMQGGLLASVVANSKSDELANLGSKNAGKLDAYDWAPVGIFLTAKLLSHTLLGAALGALGSVFTMGLTSRLVFQGVAAVFMLGSALNLLDVHPIFRRLAFQPPRFALKLLKKSSFAPRLFAPGVLGFLTILVPCGVTQTMEVLAIASGSPLNGALIMAVFVIGTLPMFALLGLATARLSETWRKNFTRVAAASLVVMFLYSTNGILQVLDSSFSIQKLGPKLVSLLPPYDTKQEVKRATIPTVNGVQKVEIRIQNSGYSPSYFSVNAGTPVELTLSTRGVYSCASAFTFRAFNIFDILEPVDTKVHRFTPSKKGRYTFSCSMGMYSGVMEVI